MVNAQDWLDQNYPREGRKNITELKISGKNLEGDLDLSDFVKLELLNCSGNQLTNLDLSQCVKLERLFAYENDLTSVNFLTSLPHPEKLEKFYLTNNNIAPTDIACFSRFTNLRTLMIGSDNLFRIADGQFNRFYGSLQAWQNLTNLTDICLEATDVASGLEYLPLWIEKGKFYCDARGRKEAKCQAIKEQLKPYDYDVLAWQLAHWDLVLAAHPDLATNPQLKKEWLELITRALARGEQILTDLQRDTSSDKDKKIARLSEQIKQLTQAQRTIAGLTDAEFSSSASSSAQTSANHSPDNSPNPSRANSPVPDNSNPQPPAPEPNSLPTNEPSPINQLQADLTEQQAKLTTLNREQEQLQAQLTQKKQHIEELEQALINSQTNQEQLIEENNNVNSQNQQQKQELEQLKKETEKLEQELKTSQEQTQQLQAELSETKTQLTNCQISLQNAQLKHSQQVKKILTLNSQVESYKKQIQDLAQKLARQNKKEIAPETTPPSSWWTNSKEVIFMLGGIITLITLWGIIKSKIKES